MEATTTTSLTLSALLVLLISPSLSTNKHDLLVATEEMQRANYFTFVSLINMLPPVKIPSNITFLMPNDRTLSKTAIPENDVLEFLLKHSIPSPLFFDHLERFPTNSIIPSSESGYVMRILNNGRRRFFFNNVRLISPNICTSGGSSIRCHGADAVLVETNPLYCFSSLGPSSLPPPFRAPPPPIYWIQDSAPESAGLPSHSGVVRLLPCGRVMVYLEVLVVILVCILRKLM